MDILYVVTKGISNVTKLIENSPYLTKAIGTILAIFLGSGAWGEMGIFKLGGKCHKIIEYDGK